MEKTTEEGEHSYVSYVEKQCYKEYLTGRPHVIYADIQDIMDEDHQLYIDCFRRRLYGEPSESVDDCRRRCRLPDLPLSKDLIRQCLRACLAKKDDDFYFSR